MTILTIAAHNIDKEFEQHIAEVYGVTIVDTRGAPWAVIFEGAHDNLIAMVENEWGTDVHDTEAYDRMLTD